MELLCNNLGKTFGSKTALQNVNITLRPGGVIGLIGPNGAGKSTLIKIIATLLKPSQGQLLLNGQDVIKNPDAIRKLIGYLPQQVPVYPNLTATEFLTYMAAVKGLATKPAAVQIGALLQQLHLTDAGRTPLGAYSGGMRQRVGIACALLGDPKIIVADEPTTGLDPQERVTLRSMLSELSATRIVLLSTHIVSDIQAVASQIILLKSGQLLYNGTPQEISQKAQGSVWQYTLPPGQLPSSSLMVSSMVQTSSGVQVRAISAQPPAENAQNVSPTLEDACLAMLEGGFTP